MRPEDIEYERAVRVGGLRRSPKCRSYVNIDGGKEGYCSQAGLVLQGRKCPNIENCVIKNL